MTKNSPSLFRNLSTPLRINRKSPVLWVSVLTLVIVCSQVYSLYMWFSTTERYTPMVHATMKIKLEATTAHLWFEEIISGDPFISIEDVWKHLDQAERYARAMLDGGENETGKFVPLDAPVLRHDIEKMIKGINSLRSIAKERWALQLQSGVGSNIDQKLDQAFNDFMVLAGVVEMSLQRTMKSQFQEFGVLQILSIAIIIMLSVTIGFLLRRNDRRHANDLLLLQSNEVKLRESEVQLINVINGASLGYWDWQYQTGDHYVNEHCLAMLGLERSDIVNKVGDWEDRIHTDDRERVERIVEDSIKSGKTYVVEFRMRHKNGHWVWIQSSGSVVSSDPMTNEPLRLCGTQQDISESKLTEDNLRISEARLAEAQRIAQVGSWEWIAETDTPTWSKELCAMLEVDPDKPVPTVEEQSKIYTAESMEKMHSAVAKALQTGAAYEIELETDRKGSAKKWILGRGEPWFDVGGNIMGIRGTALDITERKLAEEALRESEKKYRGLLETSPDGMVIVNTKGEIEIVNHQLQKMTGYTPDELVGQPVEMLVPDRFETHKQQRDNFVTDPHVHMMGQGLELFVRCKDGSEFPAEINLSPLGSAGGTSISAAIRDITQRKQATEQLNYQASHDTLTGLVNRTEFERRAERLLSSIKSNEDEHAMCYMDLDQFKVVNDTCGHAAGDEMLRQLSSLLKNTVRHRDTLARLGGDEFGMLMEHCSLDDAHRVVTSLLKVIQDSQFSWEGQTFKVGVSMGLVPINPVTANLTELLKQADAACYMAKDKGRNRIHVYHPEDSELAQRHGEMQWVTRINQALEEGRFCFYAQTILPLDDSTDKHFELLLRMIDEEGKTVPPGAFLPAAERYNLIVQLDCWVVENAFVLLAANPDFLDKINFISINLSGQSITDNTVLDFIISKLNDSGIAGNKICFEITETAAISNLNSATKFIAALKRLGCLFALDDFGSGLSSFAYLKNLPVDYLKIDGMFVKDIVDDPIDRAMVKSINEIGQVMGMKTIAEFVENNEIKGMLREIGVNYAQGYGIGQPQSFDVLLGEVQTRGVQNSRAVQNSVSSLI